MNAYIITAIISGVFSVIVGFGTVALKDYLEVKKSKRQKEENESITGKDLESMMEIQEFLDMIIEKWSIDRGSIYQFHNGGKFFNGVSMKKYSLTYESTAPGIMKVKESSQNVFVTEHPHLMKQLSENVIFSTPIEDPSLDYIRDRLEEQGIVQIISVPIRSLNNVLVGFVQFAMIKNKIEVTEEMEEDLVEAAQRISGYLHY
jgi:hypothetical protein